MTNSETLVGFKLTEEQVKEVIQMLYGQSSNSNNHPSASSSDDAEYMASCKMFMVYMFGSVNALPQDGDIANNEMHGQFDFAQLTPNLEQLTGLRWCKTGDVLPLSLRRFAANGLDAEPNRLEAILQRLPLEELRVTGGTWERGKTLHIRSCTLRVLDTRNLGKGYGVMFDDCCTNMREMLVMDHFYGIGGVILEVNDGPDLYFCCSSRHDSFSGGYAGYAGRIQKDAHVPAKCVVRGINRGYNYVYNPPGYKFSQFAYIASMAHGIHFHEEIWSGGKKEKPRVGTPSPSRYLTKSPMGLRFQ